MSTITKTKATVAQTVALAKFLANKGLDSEQAPFHHTPSLRSAQLFIHSAYSVVLSLVWTPLRLRAYPVCVHLMYSLY